jgi:hypothetical protein
VFKWDKEQVDRQPSKYLKRMLIVSKDMIEDTVKNIFGGK